jgi:hypothetical protein
MENAQLEIPINPLVRKEIYSIEKIMPLILAAYNGRGRGKIILDGDSVKVNGLRLFTFATKGIECVGWKLDCKIVGSYFAKERQRDTDQNYHLNLYALDENNNERMMTRDHIIPRSRGGADTLENSQCLCYYCNQRKGNTMPDDAAI